MTKRIINTLLFRLLILRHLRKNYSILMLLSGLMRVIMIDGMI